MPRWFNHLKMVTHPSTNWARRWLTSLIRPTMLTITPCRQRYYTLLLYVQGASSPDLCSVYVDLRALRNDRVTLVEKGSPQSLCLMESGKVQCFGVVVLDEVENSSFFGFHSLFQFYLHKFDLCQFLPLGQLLLSRRGCLCVCVCVSIVPKRLSLSSCDLHQIVAQPF